MLLCCMMLATVACKQKDTKSDTDTIVADSTHTTEPAAESAVAETTPASTSETTAASVPPPAGVKYGYINSMELLSLMPDVKAADKKLETFARQSEGALQTAFLDYQNKLKDAQEKAGDMTPVQQEAKMKELAEIEQRLQQMQGNSQNDFLKEKERLYAPILDKANKAIKRVGEKNGYIFIYDAPALLYADTTLNVMPLVKAELGLK